jgi:hypothetical protein
MFALELHFFLQHRKLNKKVSVRITQHFGAFALTIVVVETQQCVLYIELRVTVNYVTILSAAQQCFCDKFMSLATMKRTQVFR